MGSPETTHTIPSLFARTNHIDIRETIPYSITMEKQKPPTKKDDTNKTSTATNKLTDEEAVNLFSSLLFGWNNGIAVSNNKKGSSGDSHLDANRTLDEDRHAEQMSDSTETNSNTKTAATATAENTESLSHAEIASQKIAEFIKEDRQELVNSWIFKESYKQIQWQRDSYLVGTEYAVWNKRRRIREQQDMLGDTRSIQTYLTLMPWDDSLASKQLAKVASDFIPTATVKNALLPIVLKLPQSALYRPSQTALFNIIQGQQHNLDRILKNAILGALNNPNNRHNVKQKLQGMILYRP